MAEFYKILKAEPLGDPWTPNAPDAKPIQNWWCQVEGEEWAVSIGKQVPNVVVAGEHVYGELVRARSQRGTDYWKFKSQKVPDNVQRPASSPAQASAQAAVGIVGDDMPAWFIPTYNMVEYIYKQLKKMDTDQDVPAGVPITYKSQVEQVAGEPITPEYTKMLDDIFSPPEEAK